MPLSSWRSSTASATARSAWRRDEHGGYPLGNPFRRRHDADDPLGAPNGTPVNLAGVQGDDVLLDMLGAEVARELADAELARVLVEWRPDVDTEPASGLPDTDMALAAIRAGRRPRRRRVLWRFLRRLRWWLR